jgi:hypothetical protein
LEEALICRLGCSLLRFGAISIKFNMSVVLRCHFVKYPARYFHNSSPMDTI